MDRKEEARQEQLHRQINPYHKLIDIMQKTPVNYNKFVKDPLDGGSIGKVYVPPKGGVFTEITGFDAPYRGFPLSSTIEKLNVVKRMVRVMLLDTYDNFKNMTFYQKVRLFFIRKRLFMFAISFINGLHDVLRFVFIKPIKYSEPVREIYRVMTLAIEKENKPGIKLIARKVRDLVCMILEFDNAYRYRLQDYAEEIVIERLYFNDNDKAFTAIRKDYKFKHKKELGNPKGLAVEPECRKLPKAIREEADRIKKMKEDGKIYELKAMKMHHWLEELDKLQAEQDKQVKQYKSDVDKLKKDCGFVLREDRIKVEESIDGTNYFQQTGESVTGGTATVSAVERTFASPNSYALLVPARTKFLKVSAKATGTTLGASITISGHLTNREVA